MVKLTGKEIWRRLRRGFRWLAGKIKEGDDMVKVSVVQWKEDGTWHFQVYVYAKDDERKWIPIYGGHLRDHYDWANLVRLIGSYRKAIVTVEVVDTPEW